MTSFVNPEYKHISVKIIADSYHDNHRITTFELEYPRFIHGEFNTHAALAKSAQSSRAVPTAKLKEIVQEPVEPIQWGLNQSGMSSENLLDDVKATLAKSAWKTAAKFAFGTAELLNKIGLHKQWTNRITEPFSPIKVVVTATDWDNFFWLRTDKEAVQPEFYTLACLMQKAMQENTNNTERLLPGEWHTPYVTHLRDQVTGKLHYYDTDGFELTQKEAIEISASCSAQVSYRKLNDSREKALEIFGKLFSGPKPHLSPTEHQATPMVLKAILPAAYTYPRTWEHGVTHLTKKGEFYSGKFKGWIQYRHFM